MSDNLIEKYNEELEKAQTMTKEDEQKRYLIADLKKRSHVIEKEIAYVEFGKYDFLKSTFLSFEKYCILIFLIFVSVTCLIVGLIPNYAEKDIPIMRLFESQSFISISLLVFITSSMLVILLSIRYFRKIANMDHSIYIERLTKISVILQNEITKLENQQNNIDINVLTSIDNLNLIKLPYSDTYAKTCDLFKYKRIKRKYNI